ncbi:hypothetical protein DMP06_08050 [Slackia equolifaciens]|uniref:Uncharacterized protein n=2 Tax=Slackia equolifaciens TaxID=498718 RepID=A0A3N0AW26_9ACTN|nr:hypothetical protein DMP06_08050 [Slackia equolifaciens]
MNVLCMYEDPNKGGLIESRNHGIVVDLDTGVNYFAKVNYCVNEVICPRLNPDGSLFVTPKAELERLRAQAKGQNHGPRYI